jgi:hypothetical protein
MNYYKVNDKICISFNEYWDLELAAEEYVRNYDEIIFFLNKLNPRESRQRFCVSDPELMFITSEGVNLIEKSSREYKNYPLWVNDKIQKNMVASINTNYPNWKEALNTQAKKSWKINVVGLGDVGSTLVTGLRLLGDKDISEIGIFDLDKNKSLRLLYEANSILSSFSDKFYPEVIELEESELFNCNMFVFCVTAGVPPIGSENSDVRIAQLVANSKIIKHYAKKARNENFKGIFAVVSDPVDLLCKVVLNESNYDENNNYDYKGLLPDQIHGYGLGVMNARAVYYSKQKAHTAHYVEQGRAFGPHGEGLIIADSIENYNDEISLELTNKAQMANIEVRQTGFKPYIAPAFSSGSLSIVDTIKGNWHYSSSYMGKIFMGAKNRVTPAGIEIERLPICSTLKERLNNTYERLSDFNE